MGVSKEHAGRYKSNRRVMTSQVVTRKGIKLPLRSMHSEGNKKQLNSVQEHFKSSTSTEVYIPQAGFERMD